MRASLPLVALIFVSVGCGKSAQNPNTGMTAMPQCGEEPTPMGNDIATVLACAFEQQVSNIQRNGYALTGALSDAQGVEAAQMMMGCGSYMMGTDASGTTVIINTEPSDSSYGEVRSHGAFHIGYSSSSLPARLSVPLRVDTH